MDESEKQAILDGYYNYIQKWMAKFPIEQLPAKLLVEIFKQLPADEMHKLRLVCRSWYDILTAAADSLPKRRVDWLDLNVTSSSTVHSEVTLCSRRDGEMLWSFADFSRIFNDVRTSGLILCGRIKFGPNSKVAQHLPSLLTLKDHAQFRPRSIDFEGSDMKGVTEQQLIDCASSFGKHLKMLKFYNLRNVGHIGQSNTLLADLCAYLPGIITDFRSLNITILTTQTILENVIRKWKSAEARTCTLNLLVLDEESVIIKGVIREIDGKPFKWNRKTGVGKMRHPQRYTRAMRREFDPHFFYIQLYPWETDVSDLLY